VGGNNRAGFELQIPRDINLLIAVAMMGFFDADQAMLIAPFHSRTRVNARLAKLVEAGLLQKRYFGTIHGGRRALYSNTPAGAALAHVPYRAAFKNRVGTTEHEPFIHHHAAVNAIYIALKYKAASADPRLLHWQTFTTPIAANGRLIPDAAFQAEGSNVHLGCFLEVDLGTETRRIWQRKIQEYLKLAHSRAFVQVLPGDSFRVLVVTTSIRRLRSISAVIAKQTTKMFWLTTIESINGSGVWSEIWFRPGSDNRVPLP